MRRNLQICKLRGLPRKQHLDHFSKCLERIRQQADVDGAIQRHERPSRISSIFGYSIVRPTSNINLTAATFPASPYPGGTPFKAAHIRERTFWMLGIPAESLIKVGQEQTA